MLFIFANTQSFAEQKVTFYHYDLLGSPVATTDKQGNVIWREQYEPWGKKTLNQDGDHDNVRGYTGHVNDKETGLTYMQARYYDPEIGRFMSIDPVGFKEDNPIMFNRYAYANNNPYKFTDPNGEEPGSEDGNDEYNEALATHTYGVDGISNFDRSAISSGNVHQASPEAQNFMRGVPDSQYAQEMAQLGGLAAIAAGIFSKGKSSTAPNLAFHKGYKDALSKHKNSDLTKAGRALTKHPEVIGKTKANLRDTYNTDQKINEAAAAALKNIMRSSTKSTSQHSRFGTINTHQNKGDFGARFDAKTDEFIGFIRP